MTFSFQEEIIADFLAVINFNKKVHSLGWVSDEDLSVAQKKTLNKYAYELADGDFLDFAQAKLCLMQELADQEKLREEYGHLVAQETL